MEIKAYTPPEVCACTRPKTGAKQLACYRTSTLAPGAGAKAVAAQRSRIHRDLVRTRRLLMRDGQRELSAAVLSFFDRKLDELLNEVTSRIGAASAPVPMAKMNTDAILRAIWNGAIDRVFSPKIDVDLLSEYLPVVQSIAARSYDRTCTIMGDEKAPDASVSILRRSQNLASQVTRINTTTRTKLVEVINRTFDEGMTLSEATRTIRDEVTDINAARIPTIARTEIGRAVDEGVKQSLKESETVTHVSVYGCQGREPGSPTYRGESTCNIQDVPIADVDKLEFHPNHTGAILPSRFAE